MFPAKAACQREAAASAETRPDCRREARAAVPVNMCYRPIKSILNGIVEARLAFIARAVAVAVMPMSAKTTGRYRSEL